MNLYHVWRQSIANTVEKLKNLRDQEHKKFSLKGTYIFGLVDNPDPWTEVELSKVFEIGLYKMFEVGSKPRYKASAVVSVILAQLRLQCGLIVRALRQGVTPAFPRRALAEAVSRMVTTVRPEANAAERQEWGSMADALSVAQNLRQAILDSNGDVSSVFMTLQQKFCLTCFCYWFLPSIEPSCSSATQVTLGDIVLAEAGGDSFRSKETILAEREWAQILSTAESKTLTDNVRVIVENLTNDEVTLGIKQIFDRMAAEKVIKKMQVRRKLPTRILR